MGSAREVFDKPRAEVYLTRDDGEWRRSTLQDSASECKVVINKRKRYVEPQERTALHPTVRDELQSLVDVLPEVADFSVVFDGFDAGRLDDFIDSDPVVTRWYHGTSSKAWKAIQQEGLLPRSQTGAEATYAGLSAPEGDPRYTYLAADPGNDVRFAAREAAKKHGGEPVILEISVDGVVLDDLEPDEDAGVDSWEESLAYMGTVRYGGPIPASAIRLHSMNRGGGWTTGSSTTRHVYHVAQAADRASIQSRGLLPSRGWQQEGVYVSTNPTSWQFMYEPGGVYEAEAIDVWEVDAKGYELEPDDNETADPEEDYVILHEVPPSRLRLAYSLAWTGDDWVANPPGVIGSPEVSFLTVTQEMAEALNSVGFYHGTGYLEEEEEEEDYYGDGGVEMTPLGGLYVTPNRDFASYYAESKRLYLSGARGTLDEGDEVIHRITILPGAEIALDEDPFGAYDAFKHYQHTQPFFGLYGAYGVVRDLMAEAGVLEDFEADLSRIEAEIEEEGNDWDFSPDDFEDDLARWTQDYAAPVLGEWLKQYRAAVKAGVPVPMPPELRILNDQFVADPPLPSDE